MLQLRYEKLRTRHRYYEEGGAEEVRLSLHLILCQIQIRVTDEMWPAGDCLVDTGAPLTVIPRSVWTRLPEGSIQWLSPADEASRKAAMVRGSTGDAEAARLGKIEIALVGSDGVSSPNMRIVAKFADGPNVNLDRVLLGMAGNALENRVRLDVDFVARNAVLY